MICQRPAHKARGLLWEFVGGKVESGETKEQALIRECREELAVTLSVGNVFMYVIHEYSDITVHLTLFNATIADGVPQKLEHNDIRWITSSEIPNYAFCPADEEILQAARLACLDRFLAELSDGLDTVIGERGIGLSEGQAQRVAVARALLSRAPILLLDECTSALAAKTETELLRNIASLRGKTCLIVTHRRAALEICNSRIHIGAGKVETIAI